MEIKQMDIEAQDVLSIAILDLINSYPGLESGESFSFASLPKEGGLAMYPLAGAAITERKVDVIGHVRERGAYPLAIVNKAYGLNQSRKINTKEWLDTLGKWLEKQPITVGLEEHQLKEYPQLTQGRTIKQILRTSTSTLDAISEDGAEMWSISLSLSYERVYYL